MTGSGTNVITINPTNDFESAVQYYLQIDASAFDDPSSNSFLGINDKSILNFQTSEESNHQTNQTSDLKNVKLNSSNPADNSTESGG